MDLTHFGNTHTVIKARYLPVPEVARACDIETKREFDIPTGRMIHCIQLGHTLTVSLELYENLLKNNFELFKFTTMKDS